MSDQRSPMLLVASVLVMGGVCGGLFALRQCKSLEDVTDTEVVDTRPKPTTKKTTKESSAAATDNKLPKSIVGGDAEKQPEDLLPSFQSSAELIQSLEAELLKVEDPRQLGDLFKKLGVDELSDSQLEQLFSKIGKNGINLKRGNSFDEVGELDRKRRSRWALNFKDGSRAFLDIKKGENGWAIEKMLEESMTPKQLDDILTTNKEAQKDSLIVAHSFVQFAINQQFGKAKQLVNPDMLSDVQLAGLCILFDEGSYQLREPRGVLRNYHGPTLSGFVVNLIDSNKKVAQFSLLLNRPNASLPWKVKELNFSALLETFIKTNGGDSYYSPFVKSPQGGQSIVVYFDFDTQKLSPRTERQLSIVANVLKLDASKRITLTGHTDAVGGSAYNKKLSTMRAEAVKDYLVSKGVEQKQIRTIGFGSYRPRKANTLADGTDNPDGRKANRRTEIYLDF